jgi:hypothetical protein
MEESRVLETGQMESRDRIGEVKTFVVTSQDEVRHENWR